MPDDFATLPRLKITSSFFFDRAKVTREVGKRERRILNKGGAKTRTIAQRSMRYRAESSPHLKSKPGQPPRAVKEHPLLRKLIFYRFDRSPKQVVIGPIALRTATVPAILERGGISRFTVREPEMITIRIKNPEKLRDSKGRFLKQTKIKKFKNPRAGKRKRVVLHIKARPYMRPAFAKMLTGELPAIIRSVNK